MNEVAGSQTFLTGSAVHRESAPIDGGKGFVRSSANRQCSVTQVRCNDILIESRGWYPHNDRIVSHISHVLLGSPPDMAGMPDCALMVELAALAPDGTRIFCIVTGRFWCIEVGLVLSEPTRLCLAPGPVVSGPDTLGCAL